MDRLQDGDELIYETHGSRMFFRYDWKTGKVIMNKAGRPVTGGITIGGTKFYDAKQLPQIMGIQKPINKKRTFAIGACYGTQEVTDSLSKDLGVRTVYWDESNHTNFWVGTNYYKGYIEVLDEKVFDQLVKEGQPFGEESRGRGKVRFRLIKGLLKGET